MSDGTATPLFKILLLGDAAVGKSSLLLRYTENKFDEKIQSSIATDFKLKTVTIEGVTIRLQIKSFKNVDLWLEEFSKNCPHSDRVLVGTKTDCAPEARQVELSDVQAFLESQKNLKYFETSAKSSSNVDAAFMHLVGEIKRSRDTMGGVTSIGGVDLTRRSGRRLCTI